MRFWKSLEQQSLKKSPSVMKIFYTQRCSKWQSLATMASVTEELNFEFMRRVATVLVIDLPQLPWFETGVEGC